MVGFLLLAAFVGLLGVLLVAVARAFGQLDDGIVAAIITAAATAVAAVGAVVVGRIYENRASNIRAQQEARREVYESFVGKWLSLMGATRAPTSRQPMTQERVYEVLGPFIEKLMVWGSDETIKTFVDYRYLGEVANSTQQLQLMEGLLRALRKDLGLRNRRLRSLDLTRLYVKDLGFKAGEEPSLPRDEGDVSLDLS